MKIVFFGHKLALASTLGTQGLCHLDDSTPTSTGLGKLDHRSRHMYAILVNHYSEFERIYATKS